MCYGSIDNTFSKEKSYILNHIPKIENKIFFRKKFRCRLYVSDSEYNILRLKLHYYMCVFEFMFTQKSTKDKSHRSLSVCPQ